MGQVYFDMGFLSSTEVVECSASDLVGQYVGQVSALNYVSHFSLMPQLSEDWAEDA
jgi:hypothetical protein